ncbi:protein XRI1 [Arachis ipaensis]|uniref:protein XRI1 n=1 Tax=Arachis ipaensis TaxID=130454 RepID=UPI0007AF2B70|nr:protein XRI1 [Arachis ipaensis]
MDYNNNSDDDNSGAKEPWNWHGEDHDLQKTSNFEEPWNGVLQNEDISYMFEDETTPVKACGDLVYNVDNSVSDDVEKEVEEGRETSSQVKRRRMLQFNGQERDHSLSKEEMSLPYFKSNGKEDLITDAFPEVSQWVPGLSSEYALGNASSSSGYEDLESTEGWLAECLNDSEMQFSPDDLNFSGAEDIQIDIAGRCHFFPSPLEGCCFFLDFTHFSCLGRKSFIQTPPKLASSVVYPFTFVKPSGAHGDVTLKEINQRIQTPPSSKSKQSNEDPSAYPKSAFSGKPVVNKTKIRTEGGKGSITIMRTKG